MKRGMILLAACVTAVLFVAVVLAGAGTAVSAATTTNSAMPPIDSVEIMGPMTVTVESTMLFTAVVQPPTATQPITADIYINRAMTDQTQDGLINTSHQSVFGPARCTASGDPYSNFSSPFRPPGYPPGAYTYRYRILVPANYPDNMLRVELFDPDTYNESTNSATITHTNYAISQGLPITATKTCTSSARQNPCLIATGEETLVTATVTIDDVNIFWFMRVDENRTPGCGSTTSYNPSHNTTTIYELFYNQKHANGTIQEVHLATYTGRPDNNHDTDLHWVSPGAPPSFDYPGPPIGVPVDAGSPKSFQLNLDTDVPNIVTEPGTGNRHIYLNVSTIGGSSENGFEIWAGPDNYYNSVPSDANERNVHVLDSPGSHSSGGAQIFSIGYLPQNSNTDNRVNIPLTVIGPEYAGETIHISLFDSDTGTNPPITFFFDTLAFNPGPPATGDWFLEFGVGPIDPDGVPVSSRCDLSSGGCNNQWIDPAYQITVPGNTENCDYSNPTAADCTPFYGGRLFASYDGGLYDTYGWEVKITEPTDPDPSAGCAAFPIANEIGIRSIHPPGTGTGNDYPDPGDFHISSPQPPYSNFPNNVPDVPLQSAQTGYVYKIHNGAGVGSFAWLVWNIGIGSSVSTLTNSMIWPGNSLDYTNHGDGGLPATPLYPHVVRGYVDAFDTTDLAMHVTDWVSLHTGAANSSTLRDVINDHIGQNRVLRLPIWSDYPVSQNGYSFVQIDGFATFRLLGHNLAQSGNPAWLLMEFIGWDTSCGQNYDLTSITIAGPTLGNTQIPYTFTASIAPTTLPTPITYTWQAEGQSPIVHTGGITDTISYTWPTAGLKVITATAENFSSIVTATHTITIVAAADLAIGRPHLITPWPIYTHSPVSFTMPITNLGSVAVSQPFSVGVYLDPGTVLTTGIPISQSDGLSGVSSLAGGQSQLVTVTAPLGFAYLPQPHQVYAMVDALAQVLEADETNNVSPPLVVTDVITEEMLVPLTAVTLTGPITGMMDVDYVFTAVAAPISATQPITYLWQATGQPPILQTGGLSTTLTFSWTLSGPQTITVTAENITNTVSSTHTITILTPPDLTVGRPHLITPLPINAHAPVSFTVSITNLGSLAVDQLFFLDIFIDPTTILTTGIPISQSSGFRAINGLAGGQSQVVTVTTPLGLADLPQPHQVYAMVDSLAQVLEADETNNVSPPLMVTDVVTEEMFVSLTAVTLTGPITGMAAVDYVFTAVAAPISATQPITYHWQAAGQLPIRQTDGFSTTLAFSWTIPGPKTITVTAENITNTVSSTHTITILTPPDLVVGRPHLITPLPINAHSPVSFTVPITNVGSLAINQLFFVDIFIDPTTILTTGIPTSQSSGFVALSSLTGGQSQVVTITALLGFADLPQPHQVYAMVDSLAQVLEADETNNISPPLVVTDVVSTEEPVSLTAITLTGPITGMVGMTATFTAVSIPISATQPITYLWQTTGQTPIIQTGGLSDTISFSWHITGAKVITVTADNGISMATAVHTITILEEIIIDPLPSIYLPFIIAHEP